ncbi:MAG: hypothetical protein HYV26_13665, partial [Candidatus Hydrogenedentes bacterium]|nr:hypothetical protein [Candidatus Hydrogenedentota bacterium]
AAGELLRKAAELELLPRRNPRDLDADILPLLDSLADWGTLRITAAAQPESVIIEGSLASVDAASSPRFAGNSEDTRE